MSSLPYSGARTIISPLKIQSVPASNHPVPAEPLDASKDARELVRLIQCPHCSFPLREPITLPCGNTICRPCIPDFHTRENISYPSAPNRLQGFYCPVASCRKEHTAGDCSIDVVISRIVDVMRQEIRTYKASVGDTKGIVQIEEKDKWSVAGVSSMREGSTHLHILSGGRLPAAFTLAEMGELAYDSEVTYTSIIPAGDQYEDLDSAILADLKEAARPELDCHVCYGLFLDPLTTACGHTMCRSCLHRVQDHSSLCPVCRRRMHFLPGVDQAQAPSNLTLCKLIAGLCPEALIARIEIAMSESKKGELNTSLFVCTLSLPQMPTFLHVFEPKYRLMMRRAMEGGRTFGMILHNPKKNPQGTLGVVPFYEYGTMLFIEDMHFMADGRSIIETRGQSRFRVLKHGMLDGYVVGRVEQFNDLSISEEEAIEAAEISSARRYYSAQDQFGAPPRHVTQAQLPSKQELHRLSTQELFRSASQFVKTMQHASAPWLHHNIINTFGQIPTDPDKFTWWFAAIAPASHEEKYKMLTITTVRERLKLCLLWEMELEKQRGYFPTLNLPRIDVTNQLAGAQVQPVLSFDSPL
ncbi:ATP-dependent protease La domain-containing protein [Calycina marina]|uniref:ATP-dependent protease La domain-containing protein n=1 Tax=Calycina marina TaxID=1763456 RepID=A0A9P7Z6U1_9HELO|nr:ATP-dependent protease La domain-containing protein [Calycina marina]